MESREIEELALKLYPIKIESIMEGTHDVNSYERNAFIKGVNYSLSLPPDAEAVMFAEWIGSKEYEHSRDNIWHSIYYNTEERNYTPKTTQELFNLYKQGGK